MHRKLYLKSLPLLFVLLLAGCSINREPIQIAHYQESINAKEEIALPDKPLLDDYVLYALKKSSNLHSVYNKYKAALEKAPQVSALPEPVLSYAYFVNSIETRVGPMRHRVGLSQPIPWFGKLSLREEIANDEARAAYYSFLYSKNKLLADVVKAYYELAYLKSSQSISSATLELLKRWEQVLSQRYRSQTGSQADLIKVQVELGKLEDKVRELKDLEVPLTAAFNSLLNRPVSSSVNVNTQLLQNSLRNEYLKLANAPKESLDVMLSQHNPEIQLLSALVEAQDKGVSLARKNYYPDFSIGADYTFIGDREQAGSDSGDDGIAAVFSLSLPINFSKYDASLREAKYRKVASKQSLESKTFQLKSVLARNIFDITDSKRRIDLFANTLIPKSEESLESTFTAFESGEASFLDLLDTERELLNFQLMLSRAQADLAIRASELRALIGDYNNTNLTGEK